LIAALISFQLRRAGTMKIAVLGSGAGGTAVTLLNSARIERTGDDFLFYEHGVTPAVGRLIEAVSDSELGIRQGYMNDTAYEDGYRTAPGFRGIKAQASLDHRYLNEDVGYGLVFLSALGRQVGVQTPIMDSVIALTSRLMKRDYRAEGPRTPQKLGIGGLEAEALEKLLY
jgi:opine dehydrogenase